MLKNTRNNKGTYISQRILIELTKHGFSREKAYRIVQKHAQNSWKKNIDLYDSLAKDKMLTKTISIKKLKKMFDLKYHTKKVNVIFRRIFKSSKKD